MGIVSVSASKRRSIAIWVVLAGAAVGVTGWALARRETLGLSRAAGALSESENLQTFTFFVLVGIFEMWERLRPARTIERWADLKTDLLSFSLAVLMNRISTHTVKSVLNAVAPATVLGGLSRLQSLPGAVKIALAICVADFMIYWIHRAQHHFDVLWRTHAWHHSPEQLYWLSGFRTSFLHSLIYNIPQAAVPMLIFGLSPFQAAIGYSISLLIQFWEHTNVRVNIGPLSWLFITPAYHRVHHSATQTCRMNLGTTFSLWDRMFGTYVDPATMPDHFPLGLGEPIDKKKIPRMLLGL
jgi:sterol desaturase/sphingolipid hydroxylase (fatty acid hydroxylase superfamily)